MCQESTVALHGSQGFRVLGVGFRDHSARSTASLFSYKANIDVVLFVMPAA